jgi:hypothetical protein
VWVFHVARNTWKAFRPLSGAAVGGSVVANPSIGAAAGVVGGGIVQAGLRRGLGVSGLGMRQQAVALIL